MKILIAIIALFPIVVLAQSPTPAAMAPADAVPWLTAITTWLTAHTGTMVTGGGGFIMDQILRRWPTAKPLDLFRVVGSVAKGVGAFCQAVGALMDGLLGQNTSS